MTQLKTPYGTIYVENWGEYDRHQPGQREEEDIIKIFDSDEKILDYWTIEAIEEIGADLGITGEQYYNRWLINIQNGFDTKSIERFLYDLGIEIELVTQNIVDIQLFLEQETKEHITIKEVKNNEYVNRIGNYYILIQE